MNSNNPISVDELLLLAKGKGDSSIEKNSSANDLDYLAARGFEKAGITASDVKDVIKRVDARTFSLANLNAIFIGGIIAVAFSSLFFVLLKEEKTPVTENNKDEATVVMMKRDPVMLPEVLVNSPLQKNKEEEETAHWKKEHFAKQNPEAVLETEDTGEEVMPEDMSHIKVKSVAHPVSSEIRFEQLPNAPVIYLEGLKVTNFHVYYYRNDKKFELINGGFDAEFSDKQDYISKRYDMKSGARKVTAVDILQTALENFNNEKYAACISEMEILLKLNTSDVNGLFYSGMSFYFLGKSASAIEYFDNVLSNKNNIFHQEAEFYKGMALLQAGAKQEAAEVFKKIAEEGGFYSVRAKEALKNGK